MNKSKIITHNQELRGKTARENSYLMGGDTQEPVYDAAQGLPGLDLKVKPELLEATKKNDSFWKIKFEVVI